jgi:hypothetical protein
MSGLTDFFVASNSELAAIFTGWQTVLEEPIRREIKNPFTGRPSIVHAWQPGPPVSPGPPAADPDFGRLPRALLKSVDLIKLDALRAILVGDGTRTLRSFLKPALLNPDLSCELSLHEVPSDLVAALAGIADDRIPTLATQWNGTEEMRQDQFGIDDCRDVFVELRRLARKVKPPENRMYLLSGP